MHKHRFALVFSLLIGSASAVTAAPSFQQAVSHYKAGKYSEALGEFKQFAAAYPSNAMSHYYMALCYQSMGQRGEARQEFTLTSQYGDASLKGYAEKALQFLGGASGSNGGSVVAVRSGKSASAAQASSVSEVLEFYTDWCHVCKEFEPVWSSTQRKVSGVQFRRYNAEDSSSASLVQKYGVHAYPTLVFLDRGGKVLKTEAGGYENAEDFAEVIQSIH
jgi:thiol-disulfide isomerase/thioredoxin